jgi:alpha-N-arabinofuranosidase
MDTGRPWVGEHSPVVTLAGTAPRGIRQSGLVLRAGTRYTGRVVLSGDPAAKVEVSVAWGPNPADRQTIPIRSLTGAYAKLPLQFIARGDTQDGSLEITGTGAGAFHIGAVSLMPADSLQGFRPGMMKYLKELGISIYRWPGGNFVSGYDWRDGVGDADQRPPRFFDPQRPGIESNDVGIDDFLFMCRLLGAEPYIAVNAGFGGAREAAEEVEYVNGSIDTRMGKLRAANGHPQPYNVKIWGVGNEMYGPWQLGHMSPNQYWIKHISFVKAMKKVDPSIKLIASSATIEEMSWGNIEEEQFPLDEWNWRLTGKVPFAYGSHEDWAGGMLANCADYIDYLGEHFYAHPTLTVDAATQRFVKSGDPLELIVRRLPNRLAYKFEAWQEYLRRMPSLKSRDIRFALDEFGTRTPGKMGPPPGPMVSALSNALTYHEMFRHGRHGGLYVGGFPRSADRQHRRRSGLPSRRAGHQAVPGPPIGATSGDRERPLAAASVPGSGWDRHRSDALRQPHLSAGRFCRDPPGPKDAHRFGGESYRLRSGVRLERLRSRASRSGQAVAARCTRRGRDQRGGPEAGRRNRRVRHRPGACAGKCSGGQYQRV